jgi:hypothetical protein
VEDFQWEESSVIGGSLTIYKQKVYSNCISKAEIASRLYFRASTKDTKHLHKPYIFFCVSVLQAEVIFVCCHLKLGIIYSIYCTFLISVRRKLVTIDCSTSYKQKVISMETAF